MSLDENSSLPFESREPSEPAPQHSEPPPGGDSEPGASAPPPVRLQRASKWFPPENFNVPWGWLDVLVFMPLFVIIVIFAFAFVIIGFEAALFHPSATYIRAHLSFMLISAQILMEIALLGYFAIQIHSRSHLPFWSTIGWRPLRPQVVSKGVSIFGFVLGGIVLALFVSAASAAFPPKHPLPIEKIFTARPLTLLFMATAVLIAPLVEETVFRGYIYPVAARSFGIVGGIIFTGAVFGLLHGSQLWGGWWQIGLLVIVGIIFTFVRARTRTNISSFLLHISYNSVQVIAVLVAMYGPRHLMHLH